MYERCRGVWPERFRHGYAHYSGPFMEEYFFRHWTAARPALPQVSTVGLNSCSFPVTETETSKCWPQLSVAPVSQESGASSIGDLGALTGWLLQVYLPIGWSTYFFSAARVTFNTSEVARAKAQVCVLNQGAYFLSFVMYG